MVDLNEEEKNRLVTEAAKRLQPLAERYELDTETGMAALFEAFQFGIQFIIDREREARDNERKDMRSDGDGSQRTKN